MGVCLIVLDDAKGVHPEVAFMKELRQGNRISNSSRNFDKYFTSAQSSRLLEKIQVASHCLQSRSLTADITKCYVIFSGRSLGETHTPSVDEEIWTMLSKVWGNVGNLTFLPVLKVTSGFPVSEKACINPFSIGDPPGPLYAAFRLLFNNIMDRP